MLSYIAVFCNVQIFQFLRRDHFQGIFKTDPSMLYHVATLTQMWTDRRKKNIFPYAFSIKSIRYLQKLSRFVTNGFSRVAAKCLHPSIGWHECWLLLIFGECWLDVLVYWGTRLMLSSLPIHKPHSHLRNMKAPFVAAFEFQ